MLNDGELVGDLTVEFSDGELVGLDDKVMLIRWKDGLDVGPSVDALDEFGEEVGTKVIGEDVGTVVGFF